MIIALLDSGHRQSDVSKEYGICHSVLRYWQNKIEQFRRKSADGYFVCSIGEALPDTIREYILNQG